MTDAMILSVSFALSVRTIEATPSPGGPLGEGPRKVVFRDDT